MSYLPPTFDVTEETIEGDIQVLAVRGEIHIATAPQFSQRLNEAIANGPARLAVDMTSVVFIDSTGLSVLLNALRRMTRRGGAMVLACANPTVLRLFEVTRTDETFDLVPTRDAAIQKLTE